MVLLLGRSRWSLLSLIITFHSVEQVIILLSILFTSFFFIAILLLGSLLDERGWHFVVNRHEALRTEDKALNALSMEDVSRVAAQLHDVLPVLSISLIVVVYELALKFISLHLKLREWLLAPFAEIGVIVHEVLNATDQH